MRSTSSRWSVLEQPDVLVVLQVVLRRIAEEFIRGVKETRIRRQVLTEIVREQDPAGGHPVAQSKQRITQRALRDLVARQRLKKLTAQARHQN